MIWIHGGSFQFGAGSTYHSESLSSQGDVVVVTINYRLGLFGFLSTGDSRLPGNYGLWDQKLAIQWVKDNIADYGGNPEAMTLFGESAGSMSISYQMFTSQNSPDLFQRAIMESGAGFGINFLERNPSWVMQRVASKVGCDDNIDLAGCLKGKSVDKLLQSQDSQIMFLPVLDDDFLLDELSEVLTNVAALDTQQLSKFSNFSKYDLLGGWNNQEGLVFALADKELLETLTGQSISEGISRIALSSTLQQTIFPYFAGRKVTRDFLTDVIIQYYLSSPRQFLSDGKSESHKLLEVFTQIAGIFIYDMMTKTYAPVQSQCSYIRLIYS